MKRKKVFIVDDDKAFLDELKHMLVSNNYVVDAINEVSGVVKRAEEKQPDIIFLDMKMSGKTGFQVADDLKHFPTTCSIPIIAMTGSFTEKQHLNFMKSLGICDCIIKPFEPRDFISKIEEYTIPPDTCGIAL
jgi:response regulator NasT